MDNGNGTATATITFNGVLPDGHYRSTILAGSISNSQGDVNFADINYNFFTLTADANHDGFVNVNDFTILAANFGLTGRDASQGDFNYDGVVNVDDFTILATRFGTAPWRDQPLWHRDGSVSASRTLCRRQGDRRDATAIARLACVVRITKRKSIEDPRQPRGFSFFFLQSD